MAYDIHISIQIPAEPDKVFGAWSDQKTVEKWYWGDGIVPGGITVDVRVGGRFSAVWKILGESYTIAGEYLEVVPNKKLVFTTEWRDSLGYVTTATVDFIKRGFGTELVLNQTGFPNESEAEVSREAWMRALESLAHKFAQNEL
jgi:uncharacterized protein YndB with AHSA1/START domain